KNTLLPNSELEGNVAGDAVISLGHNLSSDNSSSASFNTVGDLLGKDPRLGPLADNGGRTLTHALLSGSPAIDAGDNAGAPAADQRGVSRPRAMACDIGAYEFVPPAFSLAPPGQAIPVGGSGVVPASVGAA